MVERIAGAINIPLEELDAESTAGLDKRRPVIVYCWDYLCDMSPRAAARLDSLGFQRVYDYAASDRRPARRRRSLFWREPTAPRG